jgi:hypothetical protein
VCEFGKSTSTRAHRVVCGFSWLLRVIDHEAVLMDPKLFSSWVRRSVVLLKRFFGRQTSSRWRFIMHCTWDSAYSGLGSRAHFARCSCSCSLPSLQHRAGGRLVVAVAAQMRALGAWLLARCWLLMRNFMPAPGRASFSSPLAGHGHRGRPGGPSPLAYQRRFRNCAL